MNYIKQLAEDWAYGFDMKLFDYSIDNYMRDIGHKGYFDTEEKRNETEGSNFSDHT